MRNREGISITVPALVVRELPQDLLGCMKRISAWFWTRTRINAVLTLSATMESSTTRFKLNLLESQLIYSDCRPKIARNGQHTTLLPGYDLWHRRLGHATHQSIKDEIDHSFGLRLGLGGSSRTMSIAHDWYKQLRYISQPKRASLAPFGNEGRGYLFFCCNIN